jgi:ribokinase
MILVAGSANLDFVVRAQHIPGPGETVLGRDFQTFAGGKGANQAVACARAGGVDTHFLAAFGQDAFSVPLEASLSEAGVVLHDIRVAEHPTGTAFICVSDDGENAITVAPGANQALQPAHLPPLTGFTHLLMQLETPLATVVGMARAARSAGLAVVLNAAPAQAMDADVLALLDILIVNEGELATVADHRGSIAECLARIAVPTVIVTLGQHGCCARSGGMHYLQPAFAVKPVDTTGAGDTFCGALVAALSSGAVIGDALRQANAAGALACTRLGAQASIPARSEVLDFLSGSGPDNAAATDALRPFCGLSG